MMAMQSPSAMAANTVEEFEAVKIGKLVVKQDAIGHNLGTKTNPFFAGAGFPDLIILFAALCDPTTVRRPIFRAILDNEYPIGSGGHDGSLRLRQDHYLEPIILQPLNRIA